MVFYIYSTTGIGTRVESGTDWRRVADTPSSFTDEEARRRSQKEMKVRQIDRDTLDRAIRFDPEHFGGQSSGYAPTPLVAQQIMSQPVVTRKSTDTVEEAWELICTSRFRHLPIVDANGHLVGILSDRRLNRMLVDYQRKGEKQPHQIKEVMISPVLTARPYTAVSDIAKTFVTERIGAMPILNDDDSMAGIITRSDILRTLIKVHGFELRI